jgi:hypothetical protein
MYVYKVIVRAVHRHIAAQTIIGIQKNDRHFFSFYRHKNRQSPYKKICRRKFIFARPVYNEQLYSMIVWSKVALFSPWAKNRSQLKLLVIFFPLGQKTITYSTFCGTYLFRINYFFHSRCSL